MCRNIKNSKLALIGLIILFAISVVMAGGRIPKIEPVNGTFRSLTTNELMEILQKFPEIMPGVSKERIADKRFQELIKYLPFKKLEGIHLLNTFFPTSHFYLTHDNHQPPHPYLLAIMNNKRYNIPSDFNRLLLDNDLEVNDRNVIELAKTFIILVLGSNPVTDLERNGPGQELLSFPQITFLEGKRIKEYDEYWATIMDAEIKVRIGNGEVQTWKFSQGRYPSRKGEWVKIGQLGVARVFINNKPVRDYQIKKATKEMQKGELDLDSIPRIG